MTACAPETAVVRRAGFTIAADGSYAACLADAGNGWHPERWTLGGPEPYTVPLPGNQPEEYGTAVLPLSDGRVLIRRRVADRHDFALLYPTGPGTGRLPLGSLAGDRVELLPPLASGAVFALVHQAGASTVWLVHGGGRPERMAEVRGRCTGGVWLDRAGRMLALDREADGRTKTVAVDLLSGEVSPLLQITEVSNDRLLLVEPDSGLLVLRSDAPGEDRLGWGVLGSHLPVRFPESLRVADAMLTPFAAQPGQMLAPEACAVALRADGPYGTSPVVWRPSDRRAVRLAGPQGWLPGAGVWSARGTLRLPYACAHCPCGMAEYRIPDRLSAPAPDHRERAAARPAAPGECRANLVVPLQQAPLTGVGPAPVGT